MKKPCILLMVVFAFCNLCIPHVSNAQLGNLKKKIEKSASNPPKNTQTTPDRKSTETQVNTTQIAAAAGFGISDDQIKTLKSRYQPVAMSVRNFPNKEILKPAFILPNHLQILESLNWPEFQKTFASDSTAYPSLFKYYGIEEKGRYGDMVYGGNVRTPWDGKSQDAGTVNSNLQTIYEFKTAFAGTERQWAEVLQALISQVEDAMAKDKMEKAVYAMNWLKEVKTFQPGNPYLEDIEKDAQKMMNRALSGISHLITGNIHRDNLKKIVGFNKPTKAGKENAADISHTIIPGKPLHIIGYFQTDMKSTGGVPTLIIEHYDEEYYEKKAKNYAENKPHQYFQPMYAASGQKAEIEQKGHFEFAFFPDVSTLNYASHLEYIPHLNFAKWVSRLLPGEYDLQLVFGLRTEMARNKFTLTITPETKDAAKAYYDALYQKKVAAVTFPMASCQNKSVPNAGDMSKYGKLLRLDYSSTGNIMWPWPRDNEVQFNTASGYGIFEKDGKVEVINLEFRKTPSESAFKFHSIGNIPKDLEMQCPNQLFIKPEILDYGYEMKKENTGKCKAW